MSGLWRETGHASQAALIREVQQLVASISQHYEEMEPRERQFVENIDDRLSRFGEDTLINLKQLGWLRDLNLKY